ASFAVFATLTALAALRSLVGIAFGRRGVAALCTRILAGFTRALGILAFAHGDAIARIGARRRALASGNIRCPAAAFFRYRNCALGDRDFGALLGHAYPELRAFHYRGEIRRFDNEAFTLARLHVEKHVANLLQNARARIAARGEQRFDVVENPIEK